MQSITAREKKLLVEPSVQHLRMTTIYHTTNQNSQKTSHEKKEEKQIQLVQMQILQSNTYRLRLVTLHQSTKRLGGAGNAEFRYQQL